MIEPLIAKVETWAHDRNIIDGSKPNHQVLKLMSEVGELADNVAKGCHKDKVADDIGDCLVVLTILAAQYELTLEGCLQTAYDDIKNRGGVLVDGIFIKNTDPEYAGAVAKLKDKLAKLESTNESSSGL